MKSVGSGFIAFIKEQNVVGAAVGIILGLKVGEVVKSLVEDILMPAILQPTLEAGNIERIADLQYNGIFYGQFISTLIDFLVVAAVVYFVIKTLEKKFSLSEK